MKIDLIVCDPRIVLQYKFLRLYNCYLCRDIRATHGCFRAPFNVT